jgi:nitroreductase
MTWNEEPAYNRSNMATITTDHLLGQLRWRYATKKFDPARRIPDATWAAVEEAVVLTPSSYGLQPWKALVITDAAVRTKLRAAAWNQGQVTDCSHLVVFAVHTKPDEQYVRKYIDRIIEVRHVPAESLAGFRDMMVGDIVKGPRSREVHHWSARQAYIALGNLLTSAALLGLDACPMEGFDPDKYNEILGLKERGLAAVVQCAVGYRAQDDHYAELPKVRFRKEDLIERV